LVISSSKHQGCHIIAGLKGFQVLLNREDLGALFVLFISSTLTPARILVISIALSGFALMKSRVANQGIDAPALDALLKRRPLDDQVPLEILWS